MSDGLDLSTVRILNSPDVRGWPATARLTKLEFRPTGVHVEHSKRDGSPPAAWPNFRPPGWDGDLQFTLWIVLKISGEWYATGGIEFWQSCDQNGGPPEQFAAGWYYDANRWAPMTGHQPVPGEQVGFFVTAGDARNSGVISVKERSNIVVMPFPSSGTVYIAPEPVPEPPVPDPLPPPQPPAPDGLETRVAALEAKLATLGDLATVVHVGAKVSASAKIPYFGNVTGTGTVTTTGQA